LEKLESNMTRDQLVKADLERLGWRVIAVWECELREPEQLTGRLDADLTLIIESSKRCKFLCDQD